MPTKKTVKKAASQKIAITPRKTKRTVINTELAPKAIGPYSQAIRVNGFIFCAGQTPIDPAVMEIGKVQFMICQACHGPEGKGIQGLAPPLAGSNWVMGPVENLIRIQLRGLQGPITVSGTEYTFPAPMTPQFFQTDEQIAAVLTYVRNSWGNKASPVTPEQVKVFRGEVGLPALTVADLKPPGEKPVAPEKPAAPEEPAAPENPAAGEAAVPPAAEAAETPAK